MNNYGTDATSIMNWGSLFLSIFLYPKLKKNAKTPNKCTRLDDTLALICLLSMIWFFAITLINIVSYIPADFHDKLFAK